MLGINTIRTLVSGKYAEEIREKLRRMLSKSLNKEDYEEIRKSHSLARKKYILEWK